MPVPILAAKLYIPPPRPKIVSRPRLIEILNAGLNCKLILISAPAGFGKTTLISEWIASCGRQVAWLSLDEGDSNPSRFLSYLINAIQLIKPGVGERLLPALQSQEPPQIDVILTVLLNEITLIPDSFFVILDDYHMVESQLVDHALTFLIEHLPPRINLVIASREDPSLPLARLRAKGQLTELRASDLRFSPSEAADFLNQVMGLCLSAEEVSALDIRTEGWIVGLQMAALSLRGHPNTGDFIRSFTGSHRFVLDYLVEEVLAYQTEEIQDFLLQTSILDRLCGSLCSCICSGLTMPGQKILEHLERSNLFIVPLDNERRWYRYHHLFSDLLRKHLEEKLTSDEIADSRIKASIWYENNGLILDAFRQAASANDIARAERLMEHKEMPIDLPGIPAVILNWLESLPAGVLNSKPSLWWKQAAMMLSNYQTIGVEEKLQSVEAALALKTPPQSELDDQTRNLIGKIAVARAMLAQMRYDAETSMAQARQALEYLHPDNISYRSTATQILGFAHYLLDNRDAALHAYTEALSLARTAGKTNHIIMALIRLGQIHEVRNQLHSALKLYEQALKQIEGEPPPLAAVLYLGLARIHYDWNDLDKAEKFAEQSFQLARLCEQMIDRLVSCELFFSRLKISQGDPASADYYLTQAEQHVRQYDYRVRLPDIAAARAVLCLHNGDVDAAAQLLQENDRWLVRAEVLIAQGNPTAALAILVPHRQKMQEAKLEDRLLVTMMLQAYALHVQGEKEMAFIVLEEALSLAEPEGFIRLFVDEGEQMRLLITGFRSWLEVQPGKRIHPLRGYVDRLLAAFAPPRVLQEPITTHRKSELIEPLSRRELEVLHLIGQGLSNHEICERLFLALDTVKGHNRRIFDKLEVHRRTEAIARARDLGLI
ncbi:MAG: tetratricopeptide repeat protein [Anaerolineaceae bacterium]|nr:tetratricopeptide repeat protein [Anaerolineaceae bacterium]